MHLNGLPLATLLPLGALAGAAVIALYILKLRRRPVPVPFARLWERILRDREATTLFSQLKRLLSLLLQLALLALLVLALGDPRTTAAVTEGRNVVVLVDASASMQATDVAPSRFARARDEVRKLARGLSGTDRMLVAQMDAGVTPLSTLTGEVAELEAAVDALRPSDARADFARALRFATDTLRDLPGAEVVVVSDGALGEPRDAAGPVHVGETRLSYVRVGERAKNAAISGFSVRRYPLDKSRYEVMLEVTNACDEELLVELSLLGDGKLVDLTTLRLAPGERLPRFYPNLSGASETLEARLRLADGTPDDLPADDRAYALMPARRRARVQVVTGGNTYLEAALLLDEYLDVTVVAPARFPAPGRFDVTILDGVTPLVPREAGALLYLGPTAGELPFRLGKALTDVGFDVLDEKSPLLRHTALSDVNIAVAHALVGDPGDRVVGASEEGALLLSGSREGRRFVALGFDVRASDLPLRIAWPIFLLNVINDFVEEDTSYLSSFTTGTVWRVPAPAGAESVTLEEPGGARRLVPVEEGRAVLLGQRAGFYRLTAGPAGGEAEVRFAANLADPEESRIAPREQLSVDGREAGHVSGFTLGVRREIWIYLVAAVLLATAVEWLTYHRRVTV